MRAIDKRIIWLGLAGLVILAAIGFALSTTRDVKSRQTAARPQPTEQQQERLEEACASPSTYARLKEVAFEEALRIRNTDPANLDRLAAHSVVRMENPVVKSRDEDLNVTVCTGRFVLELPPGAEAGFGGRRRLVADIEYAAQAAADGSGLVYQMSGAEPIVYRLASFDLKGQQYRPPAAPAPAELAEAPAAPESPDVPEAAAEPSTAPPSPPPGPPVPPPEPRPERRVDRREVIRVSVAPAPAQRAEVTRAGSSVRPSFNCRSARTRGERMVCSSDRLAARDRAMSSLFYSALADGDSRTRAELRRTRDRFLAYRDRCPDEACVAEAYEGRMQEIRDIASER
ncbi:MAG: hypothetical protein M3Q08_08200 [Pseudomonadota bacterium]|nr:hypothetical protein [Pseudomonadota bacterium]